MGACVWLPADGGGGTELRGIFGERVRLRAGHNVRPAASQHLSCALRRAGRCGSARSRARRQALGGSQKPGDRFLVMPLYRRGSLLDVIRNPDITFSMYRLLSMALDGAQGMAFLHEAGILHRDLVSGFAPRSVPSPLTASASAEGAAALWCRARCQLTGVRRRAICWWMTTGVSQWSTLAFRA